MAKKLNFADMPMAQEVNEQMQRVFTEPVAQPEPKPSAPEPKKDEAQDAPYSDSAKSPISAEQTAEQGRGEQATSPFASFQKRDGKTKAVVANIPTDIYLTLVAFKEATDDRSLNIGELATRAVIEYVEKYKGMVSE